MTFTQTIFDQLAQNEDENILLEVHGPQLQPITKKQLALMIGQCQRNLSHLPKGSKVALLGGNSTQWIALDLAIVSLGLICVPLYNRQDPKELAYILGDIQPDLFLCFDFEVFQKLTPHISIECANPNDFFEGPSNPLNCKATDEDTATIIYTSGTSGHPKGVMLSHKNITFMLTQTLKRLQLTKKTLDQKDRVFHFLPLCFAGSRITLWTQLFHANPVYLSTDLKNLMQEMQTVDPHYYLNVPAVLERIRNGVGEKIKAKPFLGRLYTKALAAYLQPHPLDWIQKITMFLAKNILFKKIGKKIGKSLRFLVCGSAPLHIDTQRWFQVMGIEIYQVYGLTETTAIVTMDKPSQVKAGYVGQPIEGIEIKINDQGELLTKGPHVFQGYYGKPNETNAAIQDGWFHTGDLCEIDEEGRLKIMGRVKNVIIPASGHNIVPEPLEEQLQSLHPSIEHACLVGHGKSKVGVIVTGPITAQDLEKTIAQFNDTQPHYKKMAFSIYFQDGFTQDNGFLTMNQKLKRNFIEAFFENAIEDKIKEKQ